MDHPTRPPTPSLPDPTHGRGRLPLTPVALAGIAGDPELSLAAKGVLMVALSHPTDRPLTRGELLERGHEARWQVDAALAELVETRWLAPIGEGGFVLREDLDDPDLDDPDHDEDGGR